MEKPPSLTLIFLPPSPVYASTCFGLADVSHDGVSCYPQGSLLPENASQNGAVLLPSGSPPGRKLLPWWGCSASLRALSCWKMTPLSIERLLWTASLIRPLTESWSRAFQNTSDFLDAETAALAWAKQLIKNTLSFFFFFWFCLCVCVGFFFLFSLLGLL